MRYIYYILAVLLTAAALIAYQFFSDKPPAQKNAAIIVNERVISAEEFNKLKPAHDESREDFINTIITKELLIQEAQKEGFDKQEAFRRSIQNFYEQSLIKALMDKKFSSLSATVSDDEVDRYLAFADRNLDLTIYSADNADDAKSNRFREESKIVAFDDLYTELKGAVMALKIGQKGSPVQVGGKYIAVKLNGIKQPAGTSRPKREEVRRMLVEEKRELMMKEWVDGLRKKAMIKVLVGNGG